MKILQVHKYFTRKRGGGSVTAFLEMIKALSEKGHTVSVFSMQDENNELTSYSKYFISHFDVNDKMNILEKIRLAPKIIYNCEAKKKIEELIKNEKPDVAHLHNIYHYLTPSIISALKKYRIPIVMTLHAYKEICPNYKLFIRGKVCEKCKGGKYYNCFFSRCIKESFPKSFLAMIEAYVHKFLKSYEKVDIFIAPSLFMKNKCVEFGIPEDKIKVIRNIVDIESMQKEIDYSLKEKNYFLYYGRLSEEKGISDLIQAVSKLEKENLLDGNELYIVGKGPEEERLKKLTAELGLENKIKFLGFKSGKKLLDIIRQSKFIVVPSVWYENSPMVITESQLSKKPVIVSSLGGSHESIIDGATGLVFEVGDIGDLAQKIKKILVLPEEERENMGQKGFDNIVKINDSEKIYQEIMDVYKSLLK
jgi:glycosyltransferase involved in cell wall biosynthesis